MKLHTEFRELLRLFHSHGVEYLVVGAHAVGYHGYPRGTTGLDIWISRSERNAEEVATAIREFGFSDEMINNQLFSSPGQVIRLGIEPARIEILTTVTGVSFGECYSKRVVQDIDGLPVNIISLEMLKRNKLATGRPKDLNDLEHLP